MAMGFISHQGDRAFSIALERKVTILRREGIAECVRLAQPALACGPLLPCLLHSPA